MKARIIDIASDGRYLHAERGFLVVEATKAETARVPLADVGGLIGSGYGLRFSAELLVRLAEQGSPTILCDQKKRPRAMVIPLDSHHQQGERFKLQAEAKIGLRNRLWKQVVQAKLRAQAQTLKAFDQPFLALQRLSARVKAGDPSNIEAQGARQYWGLLFGSAFRRDPDLGGINACLNYGYTVLRSMTARAIASVGLHPGLGLHHANAFNSCALADDLMEPLRPVVDATVKALHRQDQDLDLDRNSKRIIVLSLFRQIATDAGDTPIAFALERLAYSYVEVLSGARRSLELPGHLSESALRQIPEPEGGSNQDD